MTKYSILNTIDFFPDPIVIIDKEHEVIAWNQAMIFLTRMSEGTAKKSFQDRDHLWLADLVVSPELQASYPYQIFRNGEQLHVKDYVFAGDDTNQQTFYLQAAPIYDDQGQLAGAIEIIRDSNFYIHTNLAAREAQMALEAAYHQIAAQEEELRQQFDELEYTTAVQQESVRRFRTIMEGVQLATFICDLNFNLLFVNDYALTLTGWNREEVVSQPYLERFFPDEFRERVVRWINEALSAVNTVKHGFAPLLTRDGEYRYIDWDATQLFNANGELEGLAIVGSNVTDRVLVEEELRRQLNYTQTMIDNLNEMFYTFDLDINLTFINKKSQEILGFSPEELIGKTLSPGMVDSEDFEWIRNEVKQRLTTGEPSSYVLPWLHRDGHKIYLKINSTAIWDNGHIVGGMVLADDITEDIKRSEALRTKEQNLRRITDNMQDLISEFNNNGEMIYWSPSHYRFLGYSEKEMAAMTFHQLVHPDDFEKAIEVKNRILITGKPFVSEQRVQRADGVYIWTETLGNPVIEDGELVGIVLCTRDITTRKKLEYELRYLGTHDVLTALYNRTYFEEQMVKMEYDLDSNIGVMISDLDGLKLVNDTLGHVAGDQALKSTATILNLCFPPPCVVARVGGDEFAVLVPQTNLTALEESAQTVQQFIRDYNNLNPHLPISLSIGTAIWKNRSRSLKEVYKEADNNMYRFKLNNSKSARNAVVQTLMRALEARDFITEGHGERMQQMAMRVGEELGLPLNMISTLSLLAQFHDIGKVGIPDRILFKPSQLDEIEYAEMKRHCEIGHRIALASPELASLADLILKHHEWWNGNGYPLGLSGNEIPLECRILALADAYDAMTSDRPYRQALRREEALNEIIRCSGSQFDPQLTETFIMLIKKWEQ